MSSGNDRTRAALAGVTTLLLALGLALLLLRGEGDPASTRRGPHGPGSGVASARSGSAVSLNPDAFRSPGTASAAVRSGTTLVADGRTPKRVDARSRRDPKHQGLAGVAAVSSGADADPVDPEAPEHRRTGLRGRVVDSRGGPVEGAEVSLAGSKDGSGGFAKILGGKGGGTFKTVAIRTSGGGGGGALKLPSLFSETTSKSVKTDADGRFEIVGLSAAYRYTIEVEPPSPFLEATESAPALKQDEVVDAGAVSVKRASRITGTITLPSGEPARGARVGLDDPQDAGGGGMFVVQTRSSSADDEILPPDAKTDDSGRFALENVVPGPHTVVASKKGFRTSRSPGKVETREDEETSGVDIRLAAGLNLTVLVRDRETKPIRGARVSTDAAALFAPQDAKAVETDDRGEAVLQGLPSSEVQVSISASGYVPLQQNISLDTGEDRRVLVLSEGADLTGTVVDSRGKAIQGASVWAQPEGGQDDVMARMAVFSIRDTSDAQGRFRLRGLPPGDYLAQAQAPGKSEGRKEITIPKGTRELDAGSIALGSLGSLAVTVTGKADGQPIAGATVQASRDTSGSVRIMMGVTLGGSDPVTDAEGNAVLDALEPGNYTVTARKDGFADGTATAVVPADGTRGSATVRLAKGAFVSGTVQNADGSPRAGAWVAIVRQGETFPLTQATTGQDGTFQLGRVDAGTYRLSAGKGVEDTGGPSFTLADGDSVTRTLRAQPTPALSGVVRLADGSAGAGLSVAFGPLNVWQAGDADPAVFPQKTVTTDAAGRYRFDGVFAGTGQGITVTAPDGKKVTYRVTFPDSGPCQRDVTLPAPSPLVSVAASATDENAKPVPGALVTLDEADPDGPIFHREHPTDDSGATVFQGVPSGRSYRASASATGYATTSLTLTVPAGGAQASIAMPRGGSFLLVAQDSASSGGFASFTATSTTDPGDVHRASGGFGQKVRLSGLKAGATYEVVVSAPGHQPSKLTLRCDGESDSPQTVVLSPS